MNILYEILSNLIVLASYRFLTSNVRVLYISVYSHRNVLDYMSFEKKNTKFKFILIVLQQRS